MSVFAVLEIVVPYSDVGQYSDVFTFRLPNGQWAEKLTIISRDADAVVQVKEDPDAAFPPDAQRTEQSVDRGFQSFVYVTPVAGFRFRCREPGQTTRITFTAYG